ncbi:MAG: hypothetical protein K2X93_24420 [Candidatus Obscuribacterales bacterium]|nr:hypothetical protein [Candidatus Obscuribacterales bacterium]
MSILLKHTRAVSLVLAVSFSLHPLTAYAQEMTSSGPIDIQADEQEFADDHVVARGRVKVVHGDTIIRAPVATLFRDEAGQPKLAIFTGNPTLVQGPNLVRARKLTFDIKGARIIAEGNAHSEVMSNSMDAASGGGGGGGGASDKKAAKPKKQAPKDLGDPETIDEAEPDSEVAEGESSEESTTATATKTPDLKKPPADNKPKKIITDSDKQEFERNSGKFEAHGNVRVNAQGIAVKSNHLRLVYGTDQKVEAVVFTGDVTAKRDSNVTQADVMTYFLTTQRLQATGHVKSRVVQETAGTAKKGGLAAGKNVQGAAPGTKVMDFSSGGGQEIIIISDAQDYNKENGRVDAEGRVRLYYGNTIGVGPKISMTTNEYGETDRVVFIGRSQITQPGRRWIADRITYTVEDNKVLAEGNTRAIIVKNPAQGAPKAVPKPVPTVDPSSRLVDDGRSKIQ